MPDLLRVFAPSREHLFKSREDAKTGKAKVAKRNLSEVQGDGLSFGG
jgi:hypothetical protein